MKSIVTLFIISFLSFGCSSLGKFGDSIDRTFSRDGLTSAERQALLIKQAEEDQKARDAAIAAEKAAFDECVSQANKENLTDLKKDERCYKGYLKGLAKNSAATYYLWFDGSSPFFAYYDKNEKFMLTEVDKETIDARRSERIRMAETQELMRLQRIQTYNSSIAVQNQQNQNAQQRRQNCIRNSSASAAVYCN